jgi:hypothetical protein
LSTVRDSRRPPENSIAAIEDPAVIVRILTHLELARARPAAIPGTGIAPVPSGLIPTPRPGGIGIRFSRWPGIALGLHSPHRPIGLNRSTASGSLTAAYPQKLNALSAHPFD